jgi:hypothetical protein
MRQSGHRGATSRRSRAPDPGLRCGNRSPQASAGPGIAALSSSKSGQNASQAAAVPYIAALSSAGSGQSVAPQAVAQPLTQGLTARTNDSETPFIVAMLGKGVAKPEYPVRW